MGLIDKNKFATQLEDYFDGLYGYSSDHTFRDTSVTHWMLLPVSPIEKEHPHDNTI